MSPEIQQAGTGFLGKTRCGKTEEERQQDLTSICSLVRFFMMHLPSSSSHFEIGKLMNTDDI